MANWKQKYLLMIQLKKKGEHLIEKKMISKITETRHDNDVCEHDKVCLETGQ